MERQTKLGIKRIKRFSKSTFKDLNKLFLQLSFVDYQMTASHFKKVLGDKNTRIFALYDKKSIVGTVTLVQINQMRIRRGLIEDFVVDKDYRGRGLGRKLMLYAVKNAKKNGIKRLSLSSEPERKIANMLYRKIGFKIRKVNYYSQNI